MKIYDVLTESQEHKIDEGPVRFLKRTLGKNTASGKKAQVEVEIEQEAKRMYKDIVADIGNYNDPRMTVGNVAKWAQGAGFISDKAQVIKMLRANPTFANKLDAVAGKAKKGAQAVGKKAKAAATSVKTAAGNLKKKLTPEPSNFEKGKQGELDLQSMYAESALLKEIAQTGMNIELSKGEVLNVLKGFVKKGREAGMAGGKYTKKSSYGDASGNSSTPAKKSNTSTDPLISPEFQSAVSTIKKAGFMVVDKKGKQVKV